MKFTGDSLKILNLETNEVLRVFLSNVKSPTTRKITCLGSKIIVKKEGYGKEIKSLTLIFKNITVKKNEYDKGEA